MKTLLSMTITLALLAGAANAASFESESNTWS